MSIMGDSHANNIDEASLSNLIKDSFKSDYRDLECEQCLKRGVKSSNTKVLG